MDLSGECRRQKSEKMHLTHQCARLSVEKRKPQHKRCNIREQYEIVVLNGSVRCGVMRASA